MSAASHGTRARYVGEKCRCAPCREANRVYRAEHDRAKLYGRYDAMVAAQPIRAHVLALSTSGIGRRRLAELSGVSPSAIQTLKNGTAGKRGGLPPERIRRETAAALLAVTEVAAVAPHALVDSRGSRRRVQALVARGWSRTRLAALLNDQVTNLSALLKRDLITREKADEIAALYSRLWDRPSTWKSAAEAVGARRAMNYARQRRWVPPLAWDDIDTDEAPPLLDEVGGIDETAVDLAMHGEPVKLTAAERREAVTRLHDKRWSDQRIAGALGCADRTVWRIRQELGLKSFDLAHEEGAA